ncbi:hypothetical protein AAZX31_06G225100 [Glycine max]
MIHFGQSFLPDHLQRIHPSEFGREYGMYDCL